MAARRDEADEVVIRPDLFWEEGGQLFFVVPGDERVFRLELGKRPLKDLRKALDALEDQQRRCGPRRPPCRARQAGKLTRRAGRRTRHRRPWGC